MSRFSKELDARIDGDLDVPKKREEDGAKPKKKAPADGAGSKQASSGNRIYVRVNVPPRALGMLLKAAGLGSMHGITITAKVSTLSKPAS
jgi:hypothetical protein